MVVNSLQELLDSLCLTESSYTFIQLQQHKQRLLQTRGVLTLIDSLKNGQLCVRCNSSIVLDQKFVLFLIQYPKVYGLEFTWEKLMKKLHLQGYCQPYNASGTCITNYSRSLKWNAVLILYVRCSLCVGTSQ